MKPAFVIIVVAATLSVNTDAALRKGVKARGKGPAACSLPASISPAETMKGIMQLEQFLGLGNTAVTCSGSELARYYERKDKNNEASIKTRLRWRAFNEDVPGEQSVWVVESVEFQAGVITLNQLLYKFDHTWTIQQDVIYHEFSKSTLPFKLTYGRIGQNKKRLTISPNFSAAQPQNWLFEFQRVLSIP